MLGGCLILIAAFVAILLLELQTVQSLGLPHPWIIAPALALLATLAAGCVPGMAAALRRRAAPESDPSRWQEGETVRLGGTIHPVDTVLRTPFGHVDAVAMAYRARTTEDHNDARRGNPGWRGLAGGVLEQTLQSFRALASVHQAQDAINKEAIELIAWLGPCIGPQAFEVGPEVRAAFVATDAGAAACFAAQPAGKYLADLPALARRRLAALGVARVYGNDGSDAWCIVRQAARCFSYRRDQVALGGSGRMAACIWLA